MKIILAISGGVDSMVMLHMAQSLRETMKDELVVAHFDHGIRENSAEDATFVRQKAKEYGLKCYVGHGALGTQASEAEARRARYGFLREIMQNVCAKQGIKGEIWTAHHLDDLVESVAINFVRGTGWRGLAVLDRKDVRRPFLDPEVNSEPMDKVAIFRYAARYKIEYREDPSNSWDEYLRNRIRHQMNNGDEIEYEQKLEIYRLWQRQKSIKTEAERLVEQLKDSLMSLNHSAWERGWFRDLDEEVALELLRQGTRNVGIDATRPQLKNFREAILHYEPGKYFNLPGDRLVKMGRDEFEM